MIVVVPPSDYFAHGPAIREMHKLRHRVFKERLGWNVTSINGEEYDEYDRLDPTYLLAMSDGGNVVGSWRILPTTGPYMLRDTFPELLEGREAPSGPDLWEVSRFSVDCEDLHGDTLSAVSQITSELFCGLIEYCMSQNVREVVTVYDVRIARLLPRIGCAPKWRSQTRRVGNTKALAGTFDISPDVLRNVQSAAEITHSVIWEPAAWRKTQTDPAQAA